MEAVFAAPVRGASPAISVPRRARLASVRVILTRVARFYCLYQNGPRPELEQMSKILTTSSTAIAPDEIRALRKRLRLSQVEAGELLGGGPRAFAKYEAGSLRPAASLVTLLRLLEANPGALATLRGDGPGRLRPSTFCHSRSLVSTSLHSRSGRLRICFAGS